MQFIHFDGCSVNKPSHNVLTAFGSTFTCITLWLDLAMIESKDK